MLVAWESAIYQGRFSPTTCLYLWTAQTFGAGITCVCILLLTFATCPIPPRTAVPSPRGTQSSQQHWDWGQAAGPAPAPGRAASACAKHSITCAKRAIACLVPSTATSSICKFWLGGKGLSQPLGIPLQHLSSCLRVQVWTRWWSQCCTFPG